MYRITIVFMLALSLCLPMAVNADVETPVRLGKLSPVDADSYRLGPGDVINITVDSVDEISQQYTISETGNIIFPTLLPALEAQGLTLEQVRNRLIGLLTEYMYEPKVAVSIVEFHSHKVLVQGPFLKPGKYELRSERVPLLDIIMEAGGVTEMRENDELVILRSYSSSNPGTEFMKPIRVDLQGLLRDGDLSQNVMIQAGDVIYLTSFFITARYIYVAGGGHGAGAILYEPGITAFKALLRAGVVPDDPQSLELIIIRGGAGGQRFITTQVKFDPMHPGEGDIELLPEDIVILPEASSQVVYVAGEVNKPGALPFQEGLTVLQAVLDAGGMSKTAVGTKVNVLREDAGVRKQIPVDMDAVLEEGDKAQNITLKLGDIIVVPGMSLQADIMITGKVNNPGMVAYEEGMTAVKAIFLAGGLSDNALKSQVRIVSGDGGVQPPVLLDISTGQVGGSEDSNPVLKPGDLIVVMGAAPGNIISVLGKVRRPGIVEYEAGLTALQAILKAGGFDRGAARSKVRIVRGEGDQQKRIRANLDDLDKGDRSGADIPLLSGDIVIVPETFF